MTDIITPHETVELAQIPETAERIEESVFTTRQITPEDSELWLKMGQLRGRVYLAKRYVTEDALDENGAEYDEYDDSAEHFVAIDDDNEVIGTVRVIRRNDEAATLPSEIEFTHVLPQDAQEISRLIRDPELPLDKGVLVSLAMMRAAMQTTAVKSEKVYAVLEKKLYRQLDHHIGISLKQIGEPKRIEHYNKTVNYLVEMQPRLITSQIHQRDIRTFEAVEDNPRLGETILGKPYAPFFERDRRTRGLGRISLADLTSPNPEQYERNSGFYSPEEQKRLWESTVSIAGAGGDGGQLAITLAQSGVRNFRIADPEHFSVENLNRQAGADYSTLGHNKAEVIAKQLRALGASVKVYKEGINKDNIEEFIDGSQLVIDETEFTMPELGTMISREARKQKLPVVMALNIGFGSYVTSFSPEGMTFEEYLGIDPSLSLEEIERIGKEEPIPISKWAPHIPSYANVSILEKVAKGEISAPTVTQGVQLAAGDAGTVSVAHLLRDINPNWDKWIHWAPTGKALDAFDGEVVVKNRKTHFAMSVAIAAFKTRFKKSHPLN